MDRETNIFYAQRNLVDSIWKQALLEGINVSYPEVQEIVEGRVVGGLSVNETILISNLKYAWWYVMDTIEEPIDMNWLTNLHFYIGANHSIFEAGSIRKYNVRIGGTEWRPALPDEEEFFSTLKNMLNITNPAERACSIAAHICRTQLFNDGNKRTACLVANRILIENGCGLLLFPSKGDEKNAFAKQLIAWYESNNIKPFVEYLLEKCIDNPGIKPPDHPTDFSAWAEIDSESSSH